MEKVGDFGEVQRDMTPREAICAFGESCDGALPETAICAFGEACNQFGLCEPWETGASVGSFGELFETPLSASVETIGVFGETVPGSDPAVPKQRICAFGEACPETD